MKFHFIQTPCKCYNLTERKNDDNKIGLEENTTTSHKHKSQIKSGIAFVQLVMPTALQKD